MFSGRVPASLHPNRLTQAVAARRQSGRPFADLTISNPTRAGIPYPPALLDALADPRALDYAPAAFGAADARSAVAADFARRRIAIPAGDIALTASTSEAYSFLFKLLCNPGDQVLVPRPSYPLFDHLAMLDGVVAVPYDIEYHGRWTIDQASIAAASTTRTRALLLVSPNNPTGSYVRASELSAIARHCSSAGIAIVSDEVFADYELVEGSSASAGSLADHPEVAGFTLGGLSKTVGLPQAKLGWIAITGPDVAKQEARERLEFIADTYLSVSTPVQVAAARLLEAGAAVRAAIQARIAANLATLSGIVATTPSCRLLTPDGGWSAVLQVPSFSSEEDLVLDLLADDDLLVHPGFFFDFPRESFLIVSLLTAPSDFQAAAFRLMHRFADRAVPR
jgi:alanine-synthesizing transaminase